MLRIRASLEVLLCSLVCGCGPSIQTRTAAWPNGLPRATESYYVSPKGHLIMHGVSTYWDDRGAVIAAGTWQHGKPIDGVCWIPAAGDAGSIGGIGHFEQYKDGKSLGKVPGRP